jgi:hypothetical protein
MLMVKTIMTSNDVQIPKLDVVGSNPIARS